MEASPCPLLSQEGDVKTVMPLIQCNRCIKSWYDTKKQVMPVTVKRNPFHAFDDG